MTIAIVDYGMGNIRSIKTTLNYLGVSDVIVSAEANVLSMADKLILPGVGSYGKAMWQIRERKIDTCLKELAIQGNKPLLGICLGMQLMGISSDEDGLNNGLGFVNAVVTRFEQNNLKVPHVGFNQVKVNMDLKLYHGFTDEVDFYFTHSYKMTSEKNINQCFCEYGLNFVASFELGNIAGVQFHPELSQQNGLTLLKNFIERF